MRPSTKNVGMRDVIGKFIVYPRNIRNHGIMTFSVMIPRLKVMTMTTVINSHDFRLNLKVMTMTIMTASHSQI